MDIDLFEDEAFFDIDTTDFDDMDADLFSFETEQKRYINPGKKKRPQNQ